MASATSRTAAVEIELTPSATGFTPSGKVFIDIFDGNGIQTLTLSSVGSIASVGAFGPVQSDFAGAKPRFALQGATITFTTDSGALSLPLLVTYVNARGEITRETWS